MPTPRTIARTFSGNAGTSKPAEASIIESLECVSASARMESTAIDDEVSQ
jgi:hypothetical protein